MRIHRLCMMVQTGAEKCSGTSKTSIRALQSNSQALFPQTHKHNSPAITYPTFTLLLPVPPPPLLPLVNCCCRHNTTAAVRCQRCRLPPPSTLPGTAVEPLPLSRHCHRHSQVAATMSIKNDITMVQRWICRQRSKEDQDDYLSHVG
jgi:hypothetical protein